ncbi:ATP-dependent RNA helicase HrpA [Candidatus Methylospira mobilis]|uniref:ATP-dependent RNA helicase HrpA n=1 Tax=Candidatus Methylospira mobilis TaxID=1808979 RepID=UPI0028E6907E|nr:ATP-dependent RNA helicase HrpA [Candidatus Methylospira mobilis]WNV06814.1 ATP-dependent RNA helicase HrpA [Candidatus Methylospira mobilis]
MRREQLRLRKTLERFSADLRKGNSLDEAQWTSLQTRVSASVEQYEARKLSIPALNYAEELPVSERKDEILAAVRAHQVVIVCGETGSGKTTQLPKICLEAGRGLSGYIGHTQPRRIAARAVASRIADELKQPLGAGVGYKVRFNDHTRPDSLIKLMTDGILLAETQQDRFLDQYDTLIVDEAHERSLNIDFLLGYLRWLLPRRPDLKVVVTSATIDPQRFSRHFFDAPIIEVSGRTYPVDIRYRPVQTDEEDETEAVEQREILFAVDELYREAPGDILIFLSGEREIRETAEALRKHHPADTEILPLYSRLSGSEQERVFKPGKKRRIVLATNVAETSLTVPGIRAVIDTGYARISRYSHRSKLQRLPIERISQASANQRSGRCGRLGPGICIRLYSEEDYLARPEFTDPEILRTNLAAVMLQMKALGLGELSDFPFIEPPDERMVRDAVKTLQEINAIDAGRKLTELGRKLSRLPVDPRLARMLLAASEENSLTEVSIIVSALSLQDPRERPADRQQAADQKHARFKDERSDFLGLLKLWQDFEKQKHDLSNNKLRKYCQDSFISYLRMREWEEIHQQILQVARGELSLRFNQAPSEYFEIHRPLLCGLLGNIGFRQEQNEYLGARGLKFQIFPGSALFKARPKWIMAAEQVETSKVYGRMVAKIEPEWVEACAQHLLKRHYHDPHWEKKAARVAVFERTTLYGLTLVNGRRVPYENIDPVAARQLFIRSALVTMDYDSRAPFFVHNRQLLEEADYLQQKGRRVDLMADEEAIYQFYDERIPADINSGVTFESWRRKIEKSNPRFLFLAQQDITRNAEQAVSDQDFPDQCQVGDIPIRLEYRFEPGNEDDGVTALIPLHQLNPLTRTSFDWLVPGLLAEKVAALIKNLPKTLRKHFVPVPDYAAQALQRIDPKEPILTRALGKALHAITGVNIPNDAWSEEGLTLHLRMNYAVLDENSVVIDRSRDLEQLKCKHAQLGVQSFTAIAADVLSLSGCRSWEFGDIAPQVQTQQVQGYPALIDEGETVGLRIFDTAAAARASHEQGLVRLFRLAMNKELKYLRKNLPFTPASELAYRQLPAHPYRKDENIREADLRDDTLDRIMATLFVEGAEDIRSESAFNARLAEVRSELVPTGNAVAASIGDNLTQYAALSAKMSKLPVAASSDIRQQLSLLLYRGFLTHTPYRALKEIPRYLKALAFRMEKAPQDPQRDQKLLQELLPYWKAFWDRIAQGKKTTPPERDDFRWMLEEFRVSLFAQSLKTAYPISAKRIKEAWEKRLKA